VPVALSRRRGRAAGKRRWCSGCAPSGAVQLAVSRRQAAGPARAGAGDLLPISHGCAVII
jgi:hypothetical protein